MKRFTLIVLLTLAALLGAKQQLSAQVVVPEKPQPPAQYMVPPPKPGAGFILIAGHWVWAREQKMYVWVVPGWVPDRPDFAWSPGYWKEVPKGWKWVPGQWVRTNRSKWFSK